MEQFPGFEWNSFQPMGATAVFSEPLAAAVVVIGDSKQSMPPIHPTIFFANPL
jgi:hypothetical protein